MRPGAYRRRWVLVRLLLVAVVLAAAGCDRPPHPAPPADAATPTPTGPRAPADVVLLSEVDPSIVVDVRYAGPHNFVGRPVDGYDEPLCLLTRTAAEALRRVQDAARAQRLSLRVYDCYRPQRAADEFVRWAKDPAAQQMKAEFYPRVAKSKLFADGYLGAPTAHSRGSTLDLTLEPRPAPPRASYAPGRPLVACTDPADRRFADGSLDMGTGFDCFDPLAHTADARVSGDARTHRQLLKRLMTEEGFVNYDREWWHYRYADEPYPDTYFDFPVARASLPR
ncbi:D-Ala-D-Ala dipeptidase vanX. Metallo peptidase. MEROPS family M15D [Micromonospora matsumotoense]|uniref:D-alanyl-D-alanine dipeptidase n=1 Tax=Micromonospora matsumotoense TaxID=121616 RepID=A0A1C5ATB0_9ACTN|nr:M15 family metallopeptidase [Micromonospora matsumotoense]SCF48457.1 D-Ala-D-Ala dipeptidase vanX. Metallo peptidase. MEROPS family M15D [Micromonospora matsumotoense]